MAIGLLVVLQACSAPSHHVTGSVTIDETGGIGLDSWSEVAQGGPCNPQGSFANDIQVGTSVVVKDGDGGILAKTTIAGGTKKSPGVCVMTFQTDVKDSDFYSVQIGQRPESVLSRAELEQADWEIELNLAM